MVVIKCIGIERKNDKVRSKLNILGRNEELGDMLAATKEMAAAKSASFLTLSLSFTLEFFFFLNDGTKWKNAKKRRFK